ncbi:thymocyte nuclear protein 1-like protein [Polychytrium aggregatum]|uniref:thymocyte nuclear protein 1-like protein n=1 Tax=Polychytrium aggregatum TaxID=110093 RepID=UPI0022FE52D7|nr:thymocyte nuclear protein 1-like protein [Polychytrium aggregatum]KAI9203956.1 thymocyte nuclear protein 1-like protein [Polychytrium aggregatum]
MPSRKAVPKSASVLGPDATADAEQTPRRSLRVRGKRERASSPDHPQPEQPKRSARKQLPKAAALLAIDTQPATEPSVEASTHGSESRDDAQSRPTCYWLMKAEPETRLEKGVDVKFGIEDLKAKGRSHWDGVRNYEARNIMRDKMKIGDLCFFYHSNCKMPGIAGVCRVVSEAYADFTAFDPNHPYFDPKSQKDNPRWFMVDVEYVRTLDRFISLKELQSHGTKELSSMALIRRGRLSVQPVSAGEWEYIMSLEKTPAPERDS